MCVYVTEWYNKLKVDTGSFQMLPTHGPNVYQRNITLLVRGPYTNAAGTHTLHSLFHFLFMRFSTLFIDLFQETSKFHWDFFFTKGITWVSKSNVQDSASNKFVTMSFIFTLYPKGMQPRLK